MVARTACDRTHPSMRPGLERETTQHNGNGGGRGKQLVETLLPFPPNCAWVAGGEEGSAAGGARRAPRREREPQSPTSAKRAEQSSEREAKLDVARWGVSLHRRPRGAFSALGDRLRDGLRNVVGFWTTSSDDSKTGATRRRAAARPCMYKVYQSSLSLPVFKSSSRAEASWFSRLRIVCGSCWFWSNHFWIKHTRSM